MRLQPTCIQLQIPDSSRFLVGQYVTIHDDVISHVNITNVKEEDGGEYQCTAQNIIGKYVYLNVQRSAKSNVVAFGRPSNLSYQYKPNARTLRFPINVDTANALLQFLNKFSTQIQHRTFDLTKPDRQK